MPTPLREGRCAASNKDSRQGSPSSSERASERSLLRRPNNRHGVRRYKADVRTSSNTRCVGCVGDPAAHLASHGLHALLGELHLLQVELLVEQLVAPRLQPDTHPNPPNALGMRENNEARSPAEAVDKARADFAG